MNRSGPSSAAIPYNPTKGKARARKKLANRRKIEGRSSSRRVTLPVVLIITVRSLWDPARTHFNCLRSCDSSFEKIAGRGAAPHKVLSPLTSLKAPRARTPFRGSVQGWHAVFSRLPDYFPLCTTSHLLFIHVNLLLGLTKW